MKTLKEILKDKNRPCKLDNRSYFYKSVNAVLATGLISLEVTNDRMVWKDGDFKYNVLIKGGQRIRRVLIKGVINAEEILTQIGKHLQDEKVKENISATIKLFDCHCSKCGGSGIIPAFYYYCNGICFQCLGLGYEKSKKDSVTILK